MLYLHEGNSRIVVRILPKPCIIHMELHSQPTFLHSWPLMSSKANCCQWSPKGCKEAQHMKTFICIN